MQLNVNLAKSWVSRGIRCPLKILSFSPGFTIKPPATASGVSTRVIDPNWMFSCPVLRANVSYLVDYILFIQAEVDLDINPNEAQDYKYVTANELKKMFEDKSLSFTPWFKLICDTMLFEWWENFDNLDKYLNETQIRRM